LNSSLNRGNVESIFDPKAPDIIKDDLIEKPAGGISSLRALPLVMTYYVLPLVMTYHALADAPHVIINGYKIVLAIAIATATYYSFPQAEKLGNI